MGVLISEGISLDEYKAVQKKFYGFYKPVEMRIFSIGDWDEPELELERRRKLPLLVEDMSFLAGAEDEIAGCPCCRSLPRLETAGEAMGCLYVLEGSTLGGRIITGHVKKILGLDENRGCAFFNSYGIDVGAMWKRFLRVLSDHCERYGDAETVVESACQTFLSLDRWLSNVE